MTDQGRAAEGWTRQERVVLIVIAVVIAACAVISTITLVHIADETELIRRASCEENWRACQ